MHVRCRIYILIRICVVCVAVGRCAIAMKYKKKKKKIEGYGATFVSALPMCAQWPATQNPKQCQNNLYKFFSIDYLVQYTMIPCLNGISMPRFIDPHLWMSEEMVFDEKKILSTDKIRSRKKKSKRQQQHIILHLKCQITFFGRTSLA